MLTRAPIAALRPFVARLWAQRPAAHGEVVIVREAVLPTGCAHLVFRPESAPLRVWTAEREHTLGPVVLAGPRAQRYLRETQSHGRSVGALIEPAMLYALFGVSARALHAQHVDGALALGPGALALCEQLAEAADVRAELALLEAFLLARIEAERVAPRFVRAAVGAIERDPNGNIAALVERSGASHRHFAKVFEEHVGLTPKRFARVRRFNAALEAMQRGPRSLAAIASELGFSDQAHLTREFVAHAALTPSEYAANLPADARHVSIDQNSSRPARSRAR